MMRMGVCGIIGVIYHTHNKEPYGVILVVTEASMVNHIFCMGCRKSLQMLRSPPSFDQVLQSLNLKP